LLLRKTRGLLSLLLEPCPSNEKGVDAVFPLHSARVEAQCYESVLVRGRVSEMEEEVHGP